MEFNWTERVLESIYSEVERQLCDESRNSSIALHLEIPPVLDACRLLARTIATGSMEKRQLAPKICDAFVKKIENLVGSRYSVARNSKEARVQVSITFKVALEFQLAICQNAWCEFKVKKTKRRFGQCDQDKSQDDINVNQGSIDTLLLWLKSIQKEEIDQLRNRVLAFFASNADKLDPSSPQCCLGFTVEVAFTPYYLYGRYLKMARDVPQSPWTVAASVRVSEHYDAAEDGVGDTMKLQLQRKGRSSIEEIVSEAVVYELRADECRLHPCGREDMDVRCLGNGRPFALEVMNGRELPSNAHLARICARVNSREGLNTHGDIALCLMRRAEHSLWESMQAKAEEKRKGYTCVVWSESPVTALHVAALKALSERDVDDEGNRCLKLSQKTPLRVLHRRSLLDRGRYIYRLDAVLLNPHFLLVKLDTSAGTYVKEFVHGDLGRTQPSLASVFGCQAEILQLDVTWLYDDLEGNEGTSVSEEVANLSTLSWQELKNQQLPNFCRKL